MKCPDCGYYNLPGVEVCGQCGRSLAAASPSATPVAVSEIYPPRARQRNMKMRVEAKLGRPARQTHAVVRGLRARRQQSAAELHANLHNEAFNLRLAAGWWIAPCASLVPGLGQCLQKRWPMAAMLFVSLIATLYGVALLIHSPISDLLLWQAVALVWYSVWDAAQHSFPPTIDDAGARMVRSLRLGLMSTGLVAVAVVVFYNVLDNWYGLYALQGDQAAPTFLAGDAVVVQRLHHPLRQLERGDVIVAGQSAYGPMIERVVGLPGDRIEYQNFVLAVNGTPLPPQRLPLTFFQTAPENLPEHYRGLPPISPFSTTVPAQSIWLWRPILQAYPEEADFARQEPYIVLNADAIDGRVIAIWQPASRRRWLR